ncbi:cell adhesion molecule CEACAM5-like [Rhinoraja longicauda]
MSGCRLTALLVFLFILTGGSLGFTVVLEHSNLYVGVGRDAIFTVRPSAAIASGTWSFKGKTFINWIGTNLVINPAYSSRVNISLTTGTLTLKTVTKGDSGDYIVAVNEQDTNNPATATVKLLALEPVSTPNITANGSSFIEYNDTVVLTCLATGTDVSYTWIGNGSTIANGGRLELSASNSTLTITGVLRSDGPFACRASNPVSTETSQPFHLNVFYGPDLPIIIPDPNVPLYNAGTEVTLTCSAESEPTAQLEWYHQGVLVQSGAQLTFLKVSADNNGSYLCSAFNNMTGRFHASSIQINVQEPVSNVQLHSNRSAAVENQHSVLLTCSSNGTHLRWEWLLNDKPVQQNDRINISRDTLLIDPVNRSDAGTYKCIVSNGLNRGSAETTLQVHFGPDNMKITPRSPVNIEVGEDRTLTCSAQSEPIPTYVWSKGTVGFPKGPKLTISSANKEHSGIYTCHVSNAELRTNNSLTAEVIVQDASLPTGAIVGIVIAVIVVVAGITGGIVCLVRAKMNRLKSGSSNGDCKMSPRGNIPMLQTEYAAIGRKLPGPQHIATADRFWMCGGGPKNVLPRSWTGLCARVVLVQSVLVISPQEAFENTRQKRAFDQMPKGVHLDAIGQPRGIPNEFKARNEITAGLESIFFWITPAKNTEWINDIYYNQQRFINYTEDALTALGEQFDATSKMAWQNRQALDWLLAEKGGVCVLFGEHCCTFIPNNTSPDGLFTKAMDKLRNLRKEVKQNAGTKARGIEGIVSLVLNMVQRWAPDVEEPLGVPRPFVSQPLHLEDAH